MSTFTRRRLLASAGAGAAGLGFGAAGGYLLGQETAEANRRGNRQRPLPRRAPGRDRHLRGQTGCAAAATWSPAGSGCCSRSRTAPRCKDQEPTIGRHKYSGAPLGGSEEFEPLPLAAEKNGHPVIPVDSHVRLASAKENDGARILRRGYSFTDGVDESLGEPEAGLFFICFQRDRRSSSSRSSAASARSTPSTSTSSTSAAPSSPSPPAPNPAATWPKGCSEQGRANCINFYFCWV